MVKAIPLNVALLESLKPAPEGHDTAVVSACGCTPREALSGPMPPGFGVLALIAAPMLGFEGDLPALATMMAEAASEWVWRDALLAFFPETQVTDD